MTAPATTVDVRALDDAAFIAAPAPYGVAPLFRREIPLDRPRDQVIDASLTVTAHGVYEARIDGLPVTDSVLNPGWTAYEWRLAVQAYDIHELLVTGEGDVRIELLLGNGWYRGRLGFIEANVNYGEDIAVSAAVQIRFADGHHQVITTDRTWSAQASETTRNSLYKGQTIDARLRGTDTPLPVLEVDVDRGRLVPQTAPLVTRHEVLPPTRIWTSPSGKTLVDFGQNLVGWTRLSVTGDRGATITIRHAEVLENGELGTRPLRDADSTDEFVLSGGHDHFEPTLTFHGFQYIEVDGWPGVLRPEDINAVVVHSDLRPTGRFVCSDDLINQLVHNSIWGQKGNFLSIPADCPQRDERLGWTGDIAVYAPSAAFQFDSADFLDNWLRDLLEETRHSEHGVVPAVVPDLLKLVDPSVPLPLPPLRATAVWGDAAVWVPQALWQAYGDRSRLADHYPAMVLHLQSVEQALSPDGLWEKGFQWGDWLDPHAPPNKPHAAKADPRVIATACLYRSASFAAEAARILGRTQDAGRWSTLAHRTRAAFNENYVTDGRIRSDCATVYALAICFGLLDEQDRQRAGDRLAELVRAADYRVTTGFAGTPYVTWALTDTGHLDDAYALLLERECPSWLYPVTMGATTVWERWDSMLPDGTINPGSMTSFNHYALGAVVDWIYQVIGGIRPAAPGYARVLIQPLPGPGIDWAQTGYDSIAGRIEVSWRRDQELFTLDVSLPDDLPAEVRLPTGESTTVTGGSHHFQVKLEALDREMSVRN
jgi:alpha-L-rhamnosidase